MFSAFLLSFSFSRGVYFTLTNVIIRFLSNKCNRAITLLCMNDSQCLALALPVSNSLYFFVTYYQVSIPPPPLSLSLSCGSVSQADKPEVTCVTRAEGSRLRSGHLGLNTRLLPVYLLLHFQGEAEIEFRESDPENEIERHPESALEVKPGRLG